ncbi:3-hydroxyacyl-CoA dehydrogenase NAD-binding domain-containing protein [Streptomyces brasiliensis]|uniref:Enoyl-CoA hydratase n=1 Tax=Streptomyces brasiliensis TaxID=1954 RepID=A0A917L774_9ACTN|nr:3-hydroxyacyl-CoA dehydrogenase NAD-binding domain-containing protein [Streptomyces brasiliensis]GGJ42884.1 enoyl-CoA hydratase [Streptomyces brasiliensis]
MSTSVTVEVIDGVHVVTLDNPPVNASNAALRAGIVEAVATAIRDGARGMVLVGANGTFVSGSDLREFSGDVPPPLLPEVIERLEQAPFPVVAALDGYALGGGLELALGCDHRIGTPGLEIGLPEVGLGMVPGAGGTQRLPRLVGRSTALSVVASGDRLDGRAALDAGLLDALAPAEELIAAAVAFALDAAKAPVGARPVPAQDSEQYDALVASVRKRGRGRPQIEESIRLVTLAGETPIAEALVDERATFTRLRESAEAASLRHLFFSERRAAKVGRGPKGAAGAPRSQVGTVGVLGAGTMGRGIALGAAALGLTVIVVDRDQATIERAQTGFAEAAVEGARRAGAVAGDVEFTVDSARLAEVDLVVEAVYEDLDVKRAAIYALEQVVRADCVLASNTSYLDLETLAVAIQHPERFLGLHFFAPADRMRLVEVVPLSATDAGATERVFAFARQLGKKPVQALNSEGFIGNRILQAYRRHAEYLVEDGCLPAEVDEALRGFGFAMGPFAVADLSGLQIAKTVRERLRAEGRAPIRDTAIADALCEHGWLGRASGLGYYAYADGAMSPNPEVAAVAADVSAMLGITRRTFTADEIVDRCVGAMAVEAATVVASGVARNPGDVDLAMVEGFGFPRHAGGPLWWAAQLSPDVRERVWAAVEEARRAPVDREMITMVLKENVA